jgi:hypothetical protein
MLRCGNEYPGGAFHEPRIGVNREWMRSDTNRRRRTFHCQRFSWTAVAERGDDTAFVQDPASESGVALRLPPQSRVAALQFADRKWHLRGKW